MKKLYYGTLIFCLSAALTACGGGGGSPGTSLLGTAGGGAQTASNVSTTLGITLISASGSNSIASGQSTTLTATVTNLTTGAVEPSQAVTFSFSGNISNAQLSATTADTGAAGQAAVLYTAGNASSGTDIVTATVTDAAGKVATASVSLKVQATANSYTMSVTPTGIQSIQPNVPIGTSQTVNERIMFTVVVKDTNGNPVPNLVVNSALGSANSAAIIFPPTSASAPTASQGQAVVPGFLTQSATVTPTLTNTTDNSGTVNPTYVSGGQSGTDIVIFTVVRNGIIIASQSATIQVN